jgi:hypothetical protein
LARTTLRFAKEDVLGFDIAVQEAGEMKGVHRAGHTLE